MIGKVIDDRPYGKVLIGLITTHTEKIRFGDGSLQYIPASFVYCDMDGMIASLQVLILDGEPYAGIGFLKNLSFGMDFNPSKKTLFLKR
ncbi:MAG: hypothetical protein A3E36_01780 [Candidatus Andersenbacteria bacterium RIFCSPHIGHO2_12_FULL_45_11b]|uniref:Uncharacterized protein n=1 Tax=Candidatus Andersenbacteria bacterium RIFCSPHIGHO2_12_FULL_45_11b TaxID=1797282 RepID=A0A1G1X5W0_9BACT|nr:MAG: hypothetical protein A3E36_01780 [Candidatus Andersenbacteria bacterium RIFCSPHIGHO2_12_FULL_45_11b]